MSTCFGPFNHYLAILQKRNLRYNLLKSLRFHKHEAGDFSFRICLLNNTVSNLMMVKCINLSLFLFFRGPKNGQHFVFLIKFMTGYKNNFSVIGLNSSSKPSN
jgi:hypothetical protein